MYCGYCGRLIQRCACGSPESDICRFLARAGRQYAPAFQPRPPKWAVPPQIKRRERATLKRHYREWFRRLVELHGERCANCGAGGKTGARSRDSHRQRRLVTARQPPAPLRPMQSDQGQIDDRLPRVQTSRMKRASGLKRAKVASLTKARKFVCGALPRRVKYECRGIARRRCAVDRAAVPEMRIEDDDRASRPGQESLVRVGLPRIFERVLRGLDEFGVKRETISRRPHFPA